MRKRTGLIVLAGMVLTLFLAGFASYYASSSPDGLNKVAADQGFADSEKQHASSDSPLAGYSVDGVGNERLSGGIAGVAGVAITFATAGAVVLVVRRRNRQT